MSERKYSIARSDRKREAAPTDVDRIVAGVEPETTKTFRIPVRLSRKLKLHAVESGITEKEILIRLITEYLEAKS